MDILNETKQFWEKNKAMTIPKGIENKLELEKIIKPLLKRENRIIMEYFWASFVYQIIIYSLATHLIFRYWGDLQVLTVSGLIILLFIPFTIIQMKKFKAMCQTSGDAFSSIDQDIRAHVSHQYNLLFSFFHFKKRFDHVGIPFSCMVITGMIFKLYVKGEITENLTAAIVSFLILLAVFINVTIYENKKRFLNPLKKLKYILEEIKTIL